MNFKALPLIFAVLAASEWAYGQGDIVFTPKNKMIEIHLRPARVKKIFTVTGHLVFPADSIHKTGAEDFDLGRQTISSKTKKIEFEISKNLFNKISERHSYSAGRIILDDGFRDYDTDVQIFIVPGPDQECLHPVLISDLHDTLDTCRECSVRVLNELVAKYDMYVFIASTIGAWAKSSARDLYFDHPERFLALESLDGFYRSGGHEKAERVKRAFEGSGVCLVGFAGDGLRKEGVAARILRIPFWGVQIDDDRRFLVGQNWCEIKPDIELLMKSVVGHPPPGAVR